MRNATPSHGGRAEPKIVTVAAAVICGAGAALMAVAISGQAKLLVLIPLAVFAGIIVAVIALTRFAVFVLLMLLTRASVDVTHLSADDTATRLLTPSTVIGILFIIASALWLVATYRQQGRLPGSGLRTGLVAFVCAGTLSVPNAEHLGASLGDVLRLLAIVLMYVVLEQLFVDPRMMRLALGAVFCSAIFPVVYTAFGFLVGHPHVEVKGDVNRALGTFVQSNEFGAYLMLLIIVGVAVFPHVQGWLRLGLAVLLAGCVVCLILTYTLTALLGTAVGLVVVGIKQSKRLLLALVGLTGGALTLVPAISERLGTITNGSTYLQGSAHAGNSLAWRLEFWSEIVHLADRNPVTGIGYGMTSYLTQQGKQPHNDFLRAYVETGLIGLVVYLVVIVLLLRLGLRAVRMAPPGTLDRSVAVGYLGCAVALVLTSLSSNVITNVAQIWYFVAIAAAASAVLRRHTRVRPTAEQQAPS